MERKSFSRSNCAILYPHELSAFFTERFQGVVIQAWSLVARTSRQPRPEVPAGVRWLGEWLGKRLFHAKFLLKWLGSALIGAPWGYGERVINVLVIGVAVIALFAMLFWRVGGIEGVPTHHLSPVEYLLYSLGAFVLVGFSDLYPVTMVTKFMTVIESLLGLVTFAIFVNALGDVALEDAKAYCVPNV